jgi:hypothetical protein
VWVGVGFDPSSENDEAVDRAIELVFVVLRLLDLLELVRWALLVVLLIAEAGNSNAFSNTVPVPADTELAVEPCIPVVAELGESNGEADSTESITPVLEDGADKEEVVALTIVVAAVVVAVVTVLTVELDTAEILPATDAGGGIERSVWAIFETNMNNTTVSTYVKAKDRPVGNLHQIQSS